MDTFRTLIISAAVAPQVRALADTWPGGQGMFVTPLYTGAAVTHYLSSGMISGTIAKWMPYKTYGFEGEVIQHEGDLEGLVEAINTDNPEANATVEQIAGLLSFADITIQEWPQALARLGLSLTATQEIV